MSRKVSPAQAHNTEALTAAVLAQRLVKQPEQGELLNGKQPRAVVEDEDEKSQALAEAADDGEALAAMESGDRSVSSGDSIHLAAASGTASDAPPAAAGSVPAGGEAAAGSGAVAAGGTAMSELGIGLLIAGGVIGVAAAAGGGGDPAPPPPGDTTPPVIQSMVAHSGTAGNATIVLTYDGALDAANPPVAANFAVSASGVANPVANVAISGSTVTLTLTNALAAGPITITYTDPTTGNDVNAIQDAAGNDAVSFTSGIVADGYVRGAEVYIDSNGNGVADTATDYHVGTTDSNGNFILPAGAPSGVLIAVGGVNIDTGVPNTVPLKAPSGSTTINPLTTLVQAMITATPGTSAASASTSVVSALGLTAGTDLTSFDPLSSGNLTAQQVAAQVATMLILAENNSAGAAATVTSNLAAQIKTANTTSATLDLADAGTITAALNGSSVSGATQTTIGNAAVDIAAAGDALAISAAQSLYLDSITPAAPSAAPDLLAASDTGVSNTDNNTQATTPGVRVNFNTSALDGTAAVAGDTVIIKSGATQVGSAALTAADISAGYKDVAISTALAEGAHSLSAQISDKAGHTSASSATLAITVDTTAPTLTIGSNVAAVKSGETAIVNFTFSEVPSGFVAADVVTTGGTLSAPVVTADPKVYTATFTPTPDTASGSASITVAAGAYTDAAGNAGGAGTTPAISIDTLAPAVAITSAALGNDTTPIISGTADADATVTASIAGATYSVVATGGNWSVDTGTATPSSGTLAINANGDNAVSVTATDAAGNVSSPAIQTLVVDTTAPALTIASNDTALKIGETATITFTFSEAPIGFTAADVVSSGGSIGSLSVTGDPKVFTATFTPSANTTTDTASVSVASGTYSDAAGNTGGAGASPAISVDTQAPTATATITGADDNVPASSTVNIAPDSTTNDNTPTLKGTITGSLGAGEVVAVYDGATRLGAASVDGGNWSLTTASLGNGAHSFTARVEDPAGNQSAASAAYAFSIDATVPTATAPITGLADAVAMYTGNVASGGVSNDPAPMLSGTISGALAAGDVVRVYDGATLLGNADVSGANWTFSTTLPPGAHSFTTLVENAGGNQGVASNAYSVTLDFTAPAAPSLALTNDSGASNADKISNNGALTPSGVEAGATVEYSADQGSTWSTTFTPVSGANEVYARQIDAAGNISPLSTAFTFTFDNSAPATPTLALSNDTGSSNADRISSDASLTFSAAAADVTRSITVDGGTPAAAYTAPTTDGSHTVVVTDTDSAGNTANASLTFTLDTSIATPTVALANDTGVSNSDGLTNDASLSLSATAADVTRSITVDGGTPAATYTAPTTDGSHTVVVTDTDTAGNTANASVTFTLDTTLATPTLALSNDTGSSNADRVTSDASLTVSSINPDIARTFTVDGGAPTGSYTAPTTDGSHTVVVTDTDPAGNTRSASLTFTRDTTAPTQTVSGVDISADTGTSAADFITSTAAQTITGTLSAALAVGDTLYGSVNNGGSWTDITAKVSGTAIAWDGATLAGSDTIGFRVVDQAGNSGGSTGTQAYTLDNTAPAFTSPASAVFPNQGTGTAYTAAASDTSAVGFGLSGTDAGLFNIDANSGAVTFKAAPSTATPADNGGDNVYNFNVTATDLAGNASSQAVAISVVNAPSLQASALDNVTNFEVTSNIVLNYSESVTAVAGKYIHIVNDGGTGFHGESTVHTQDILVTDATQVSIVGGKITINPTFDLDLANTYHIMIDAGAFTGTGSQLATAAFDGSSSLNFATVTPGSGSLANAAPSQAMDADGAMVGGHQWLDMHGIGNSISTASLDLGSANANGNDRYALVTKDYDPAGTDPANFYDGIVSGDFFIAANNFGANDLIYADEQANGAHNDFAWSNVLGDADSTQLYFNASNLSGSITSPSGLTSFIDITLAVNPFGYDNIASLSTALGFQAVIVG